MFTLDFDKSTNLSEQESSRWNPEQLCRNAIDACGVWRGWISNFVRHAGVWIHVREMHLRDIQWGHAERARGFLAGSVPCGVRSMHGQLPPPPFTETQNPKVEFLWKGGVTQFCCPHIQTTTISARWDQTGSQTALKKVKFVFADI